MSRKGNCLDNAATEQVFGHLRTSSTGGANSTRTSNSNENLTRTSSTGTPDDARYDSEGHTPEEFRSVSSQPRPVSYLTTSNTGAQFKGCRARSKLAIVRDMQND